MALGKKKNPKGNIIIDLNSAVSQANQTRIEMMCSWKLLDDLKSHLTGSGEDTDADIELACKDTEVNNTIPFESLEKFNIL